jgi:type IV secretory pathway TraG/TraD family ATPase VirD4
MAKESAFTKVASIGELIEREEWDFSTCPEDRLRFCFTCEYAREIPGNKDRLCLLMIDEFASVASGNSDGEFLAMRREAAVCPIFAFQQVTQLETVIPYEWRNVLGLLSTKIFLRASDMDTAMYGEKICGFVQDEVEAVTKTPDTLNLFHAETSRTTSKQLRSRIPADYFLSMPDGDAVIVNDQRNIAWFPAFGMTDAEEITWRNQRWPDSPKLIHPANYRQ